MSTKGKRSFGFSEEELSAMSDEELESLNSRIVFVRDAMPDTWQDHAYELMNSAEILWQQKEEGLRIEAELTGQDPQSGITLTQPAKKISAISRPYILLAGFALENLIKGLLVAQDPSHINSGKLSRDLKSHKLLILVSKVAGLSLSKEEQSVCQTVQDALPYWGRYPIPLAFNGVLPEVAIDDEFRRVFLKLHHKLGDQLHGIIRDGWDSGVGPRIIKIRDAKYGDEIDHNEPLFDPNMD
jgi:hypothetical protein